MAPSSVKRLAWAAAIGVAVAIGAVLLTRHLTEPVPLSMRLADGSQAYFMSDTKLTPAPGYPAPREIRVDGDFFFKAAAADTPLIVRSRLLVLTVTGETAFRMIAYAKEAGEQVEVLYGHVQANKAYESTYNEPDMLTAGQMSMINKDIDLMEKEKFKVEELKAWSEQLMAAAAAAADRQ